MATIMHHGVVAAAAFMLEDCSKILTANCDGQIKMWDVEAGDIRARFTGHRAKVLCLNTSPDGLSCASGSEDGVVKIWDLSKYLDEDIADSDRPELLTTSKYSQAPMMTPIRLS